MTEFLRGAILYRQFDPTLYSAGARKRVMRFDEDIKRCYNILVTDPYQKTGWITGLGLECRL